jgi:hypothetical protein
MNAIPLGGAVTLLVLLPNLAAVFFPPRKQLEKPGKPDPKQLQLFTVLERIGQVACFVLPFFYRLAFSSVIRGIALAVMALVLAVYYAGWVRYLVLGQDEALFYRPLLGIPLPMAVMPVLYFLAAALLLGSFWLLLAAILLGVGHIQVTRMNAPGD